MSELKSFESERIYWAIEQVERAAGDIDNLHLDDNLFYIKSEADKVIARHKYKRCLAMAKWCEAEAHKCLTQQCALVSVQGTDRFQYLQRNFMHFRRWHKRWLGLAEKFKEAKLSYVWQETDGGKMSVKNNKRN